MSKPGSPALWTFATLAVSLGLLLTVMLYCFDPSQYGFYPICLFHRATGLLCPGCGSLRAMHQLLHGNISAAFRFNPLLVLSLPVLGWSGGIWMKRMVRGEPAPVNVSTKWVWVCLALVLAFSFWRNLPGSHFAAVPS